MGNCQQDAITYGRDGVHIDATVTATDLPSAIGALANTVADLVSKDGMERTLSGKSSGSSHAMPGNRWRPTAWQPTGPDLEWKRRLKATRNDPKNS